MTREAFRGIATGLAVLLCAQACASRPVRPAAAPPAPAMARVAPSHVSAGLAVGAEARIEETARPATPRVIAVRVHVENHGARPVSVRRNDVVLEGPGGTVRLPEEPASLAGPATAPGGGAGWVGDIFVGWVSGPGLFLVPVTVVLGGAALLAARAADRAPRRHVEKAREYDARSFPRFATLEPGEAVSGFVFFAAGAAKLPRGVTPLGVHIEDLQVSGDPEDDRAEEASPVLRTVRIRLAGAGMAPAGTPE